MNTTVNSQMKMLKLPGNKIIIIISIKVKYHLPRNLDQWAKANVGKNKNKERGLSPFDGTNWLNLPGERV